MTSQKTQSCQQSGSSAAASCMHMNHVRYRGQYAQTLPELGSKCLLTGHMGFGDQYCKKATNELWFSPPYICNYHRYTPCIYQLYYILIL